MAPTICYEERSTVVRGGFEHDDGWRGQRYCCHGAEEERGGDDEDGS
ncbi:hypothetical protein GYH30_022575 [Glycine max]|nr:hypothetical protein GYH30_022575 [Glycine max]